MATIRFSSRGTLQFQDFDASYVERLVKGDREVEQHFADYFGQLIRIKMRRRLRSAEAIEDVRQETFMRVFRILRSERGVRQPEQLGPFVNAVCNHVYLEMCRFNNRHDALSPDSDLRAYDGDDVISRLLAEERRDSVARVLRELSERDQRLLRAVYFDEVSREALCTELGVDREYLRLLVHRAMQRFRAVYRRSHSLPLPVS